MPYVDGEGNQGLTTGHGWDIEFDIGAYEGAAYANRKLRILEVLATTQSKVVTRADYGWGSFVSATIIDGAERLETDPGNNKVKIRFVWNHINFGIVYSLAGTATFGVTLLLEPEDAIQAL